MLTRKLLIAALVLTGGCAGPEEAETAAPAVEAVDEPTRYEAPKGQAPSAEPEYPPAPWGHEIGSVLADLAFIGYPAPEGGEGELGGVRMSDFYNPTRTPERPLALVVEYTSIHCLEVAEGYLAFDHIDDGVRDRGGELLLTITWGYELGGEPATLEQLGELVDKHDVMSPSVLDPAMKLAVMLPPNGPSFALIDTTDMTILDTSWGYPGAPFWATFDALLEE